MGNLRRQFRVPRKHVGNNYHRRISFNLGRRVLVRVDAALGVPFSMAGRTGVSGTNS